jgi:ubiquinone/menaquinone biosynthesis C-methylase UbiE
LLALAEIGSGARVLDVGTGTGTALTAAEEAVGPEGIAVGIDPAPRMLSVGRRARPSVRLAAAEAVDLPFREATFDVIMAVFVLPYFAKLETGLFDLVRVMKPGARLVASAWADDEDDLQRTWRELVEHAIGREVLRSGLEDEISWGERLADPRRFEETLRAAKLRPVRVERRRYRFTMPREDYVTAHEIEASGRFVRRMLGESSWKDFRERTRAAYAERFPEQIVDFREALLAVGTKPSF